MTSNRFFGNLLANEASDGQYSEYEFSMFSVNCIENIAAS
jgi:hypothetical protein